MPRHFSVDGSVSIDIPDHWQGLAPMGMEAEGSDPQYTAAMRKISESYIGTFAVGPARAPHFVVACHFKDAKVTDPAPIHVLTRIAFELAKEVEARGGGFDSVFVRDSLEFRTNSGLTGGGTCVDCTTEDYPRGSIAIMVRLSPTKGVWLGTMATFGFTSEEFDDLVRVAQTIRVHAR